MVNWHGLLGTWAKPPDLVAWAALGLAAYFFFNGFSAADPEDAARGRRRFLAALAFGAAFLSLGYVAQYLRGGPRIIDATTYFLEGRALSRGHVAWSIPDVTASFRGRFLVFSEPDRVAGIFPPGYPLLLAAGFLVGAPMLVGPLLAAALAVTTYFLAHELLADPSAKRLFGASTEPIARTAAVLSLVCAALRYHTADTMSHGAAALGISLAVLFALRARRAANERAFALAGLAAGYVLATRIPSAFPILAVGFVLALRTSRRAAATFAVAVLPGAAILLGAQLVSTGHLLQSTQRAYYAVSDGPPGCFRYGFGSGVGCLHEHGEFVRSRLPHGFGLLEALGTTLRRLKLHVMDVANLEPLALLALVPLRPAMRELRGARVLLALVAGQILAYAPFYFDGNYPGGGGRLLADVLPLEHVLLAIGVAGVARGVRFELRAGIVLALACVGFAVHAAHDHRQLAERDGGRPMYEPDVVRQAQVTNGLLFVGTDHGFGLAHDPTATPTKGLVVARERGDDHDRLLYERLGRPPAHRYLFSDSPQVLPFVPSGNNDLWTFEAEAEWPPLAQGGGYAAPSHTPTCGSPVLLLTPSTDGLSWARIELPVPRDGKWTVSPRVMVNDPKTRAAVHLVQAVDAPTSSAKATWQIDGASRGCLDLDGKTVGLKAPKAFLVVESTAVAIGLDRTTLRALP